MSALLFLVLSAVAPGGCLVTPVDAPVLDPFRPPPCVWCPGNRGIEFGPTDGERVVAAAAGTVTFSGDVAGTSYVVVAHSDGTRTTYGGLVQRSVHRGSYVDVGEAIGIAGPTLHFGWRDAGGTYLDPTPLLGELGVRPYLLPTDGTAARDAEHAGVCQR